MAQVRDGIKKIQRADFQITLLEQEKLSLKLRLSRVEGQNAHFHSLMMKLAVNHEVLTNFRRFLDMKTSEMNDTIQKLQDQHMIFWNETLETEDESQWSLHPIFGNIIIRNYSNDPVFMAAWNGAVE